MALTLLASGLTAGFMLPAAPIVAQPPVLRPHGLAFRAAPCMKLPNKNSGSKKAAELEKPKDGVKPAAVVYYAFYLYLFGSMALALLRRAVDLPF